MNWEEYRCADPNCQSTHWRLFDEETEEIFGGVDAMPSGFVAVYKGEDIGVFRRSDVAMSRVAQLHDKGGLPPKEPAQLGVLREFLSEMSKAFQEGSFSGLLRSPALYPADSPVVVLPAQPIDFANLSALAAQGKNVAVAASYVLELQRIQREHRELSETLAAVRDGRLIASDLLEPAES